MLLRDLKLRPAAGASTAITILADPFVEKSLVSEETTMWCKLRRKRQRDLARYSHMRRAERRDRPVCFRSVGQYLVGKDECGSRSGPAAVFHAATLVAGHLTNGSPNGAANMYFPRLPNEVEASSYKRPAAALPPTRTSHERSRSASLFPFASDIDISLQNVKLGPPDLGGTENNVSQIAVGGEDSPWYRSAVQLFVKRSGRSCTPANASVSYFSRGPSIRLHQGSLDQNGVHSSSVGLLHRLFFLSLFMFLFDPSLPSWPYHLQPSSVSVEAVPQIAARGGTRLSPIAAAAPSAAARTTVPVLEIAPSAKAVALYAAPAVTILVRETSAATKAQIRRGYALVHPATSAAALLEGTAARGLSSSKQQSPSSRLNSSYLPVRPRLGRRCLQHDPSLFEASEFSGYVSGTCPTAGPPVFPSTYTHLKQSNALVPLQLATALRRCTAGCLVRLLVHPLVLSRVPLQSTRSPGNTQAPYPEPSCANRREHCAKLSFVNSEGPPASLSLISEPGQKPAVLHTICARRRCIAFLRIWQQYFTAAYLTLFTSVASPYLTASVSSATSTLPLPSLGCCAPWPSRFADRDVFGRNEAASFRRRGNASRLKTSSCACVFACNRRPIDVLVHTGARGFPSTSVEQCSSTCTSTCNFGALISCRSGVLLSQRTLKKDQTTASSHVEKAPASIHGQASIGGKRRRQVCCSQRMSSCCSGRSALFAALAFLRQRMLHSFPSSPSLGRNTDAYMPRRYDTAQGVAGRVAAGAVGAAFEGGTAVRARRCVTLMHRWPRQASYFSTCECLKGPPAGGSLMRGRGLKNESCYGSGSRRYLCTPRNWLSYRGINKASIDPKSGVSFTGNLCALPPRRRYTAFDSSVKKRDSRSSSPEPAHNHCIIRRPSWLQRAAAAAIYLIPYMELFHVSLLLDTFHINPRSIHPGM